MHEYMIYLRFAVPSNFYNIWAAKSSMDPVFVQDLAANSWGFQQVRGDDGEGVNWDSG